MGTILRVVLANVARWLVTWAIMLTIFACVLVVGTCEGRGDGSATGGAPSRVR